MKNIKVILGFLLYCTVGKGRKKSFWRALSNYTGRYIYTSNKPYTYKRVKDMWDVEGTQ